MMTSAIELPFDVPLLPVVHLHAGNISCVYENGNLRYIRWGDIELIRMIYGAVRDANWETAPYRIENEVIANHGKSFSISYTAIYQLNNIHYKGLFTIMGNEDNTIYFSMRGEAISGFMKKRIGLCVLHPVKQWAGKQLTVTTPANDSYTATFPRNISPHQPFMQVHKMNWSIDYESKTELLFEGDVFETEDQRNWTDSSYKTYSTPLEIPAPVFVCKGEVVAQAVQLSILKNDQPANEPAILHSTAKKEKIAFPQIGYSRVPGSNRLNDIEISLLKNVPFNHYRVELHLSSRVWRQELTNAVAESNEIGVALEVVVFFTGTYVEETRQLIEEIVKPGVNIKSILPLPEEDEVTPAFLTEFVYPELKRVLPAVETGYGTNGFFADLNRHRPPGKGADFVSFSVHPQVHAKDTRTIIENLDCLRDLIESIKQFTLKPIHISPVTFQQRLKPGDPGSYGDLEKSELDVDERMHTGFGASWTLLCLKNLSKAGHITFYQATGKNGILNNTTDYKEGLSPVYKILAQIKTFDPVFIEMGEEHENNIINLTNDAGDTLTFVTDPVFASTENLGMQGK